MALPTLTSKQQCLSHFFSNRRHCSLSRPPAKLKNSFKNPFRNSKRQTKTMLQKKTTPHLHSKNNHPLIKQRHPGMVTVMVTESWWGGESDPFHPKPKLLRYSHLSRRPGSRSSGRADFDPWCTRIFYCRPSGTLPVPDGGDGGVKVVVLAPPRYTAGRASKV